MRATVTQRVHVTLHELSKQAAFRRLELGKRRVGRVTNRIFWHHDRGYRFILDLDANAVAMPDVMAATPQRVRELQGQSRSISSLVLEARAALDPTKGELRIFSLRGSLTLSVTVLNNAFEYCTQYLINLADAAIRSDACPAVD